MPGFSRWSPHAYVLMRVLFGLLFLSHGLSKLVGLPVPPPGPMPPLMLYAAGSIELICGALVSAGLVTRWAAFVASGEMAVAYFMVHFPRGLYPIANGGELAVLYCFGFLLITTHGPGTWSADRVMGHHTPDN